MSVSARNSQFRPFWAAVGSYAAALIVPVFTLLAVFDGPSVQADHDRSNHQLCQDEFQKQVSMCMSLTGRARAECQRMAASEFRACRGQASPSNLNNSAISNILTPSDLATTERLTSQSRAGKAPKAPRARSR